MLQLTPSHTYVSYVCCIHLDIHFDVHTKTRKYIEIKHISNDKSMMGRNILSPYVRKQKSEKNQQSKS